MNQTSVDCPFCGLEGRKILLPDQKSGQIFRTCQCRKGVPVEYVRFPALDRPVEIPEAEPLQLEDDASCFHHPDRKAVAVCADCGIFICELCEVKAENGESLCLDCYSKRQAPKTEDGKPGRSREGQVLWDRVALASAVLPLSLMYFSALTAPYTLYVVIRRWKGHPYSVLGGSRAKFVIALIIAILQVLGGIVLVAGMIWAFSEL